MPLAEAPIARDQQVSRRIISESPEETVWEIDSPNGAVYQRYQRVAEGRIDEHAYFPRTPGMERLSADTLVGVLTERFGTYLPDRTVIAGAVELELMRGLAGEPQVHVSRTRLTVPDSNVTLITTGQSHRLVITDL